MLSAIDDLGYVPHAVARSLKLGRTGVIGLVVPDITNPHFSGLAHAIEDASDRAGFLLTLCITSDDPDKELRQLELLKRQRIDGLIFVPRAQSAVQADRLRRAISTPAVLLDRRISGFDCDAVLLDNRSAVEVLTEHLLALGHRRIGIVCGPLDIELARERTDGYRSAFMRRQQQIDEALVVTGAFQPGPACQATLALLDHHTPPTALVSTSNHTTIGIMKALSQRHLCCPDDVSLAAIDDFAWSDVFSPRLTVAAQPVDAMGLNAATWLFDRLAGREQGQSRTVTHPARFIERGSTRPL